MSVKVTFLFEMSTAPQGGGRARVAGWTESWIDQTNVLNGTAIVTAALAYARARCLLLPPTSECIGVRLTDLDTKATRTAQFSVLGANRQTTDLPQMSLLLRINARGNPNHFSFYLRNVPDSLIVGGEYSPVAAGASGFTGALVQWWNLLATQYRFRGKDATLPKFEIMTINASGVVELNEASSGIVVGGKVQIRRTQFDDTCCGGGGVYKVKAVTDVENFQLAGWDGGNSHGGTVSLKSGIFAYQIAFPPSQNELVVRAVERKVGRPFDLFRGRRSPTCCR